MVPGRRLFVFLYAASGAAALVYEVTWTRLLTLQLGHTVAAASTVLAAFMGGLAVGAWITGRIPAASLRAYAILEIIVAVCALLLPMALHASVPALAWAYADGGAPAQFAIVRVALSLALLGTPAAAMGATFPIAAGWYARSAADTGALYAVNTAGAALGAIAAGFFLIPALGLRATTWVGMALNLIAAAGAWWLASGPRSEETAETAKHAEISFSKNKRNKNRFCAFFAVSAVSAVPSGRVSCPGAGVQRGGDLRLCRARLRGRLDAAARARHRAHHLRVCDDGGGVHQRAGCRVGAWQRPGATSRAPRPLDGGDAGRLGDRGERRRVAGGLSHAARRRRSGRGPGRGLHRGHRHPGVRHRAAAVADDARARRDLFARARGRPRSPPSRL